jgi:hypothetical protein
MIFYKNNLSVWLLISLFFFNCEREDNTVKIKEGDVILTSQGDINDFGKHHYIRVKGSVYVGPFDKDENLKETETDIINLAGLSNLDSIDGELQICRNYKLVNIDECLENLVSVGMGIVFFENTNLRSINGFNNLTHVNTIAVINHDKFVEIKGFSALTELDGNLILSSLHFLNNIDGFSNLTKITGRLDIDYCDALTEINAFLKLENIGEEISLESNSNLMSIEGFNNLSNLGSNIVMWQNKKLRNLDGFSKLIRIPGHLILSGNEELVSLDGLKNISTIGSLSMEYNNSLSNVNGLSNLDTVWGGFRFEYNSSLIDIDSLADLKYIGEDIIFTKNEALQNVDGLINLSHVGNNIDMAYNTALTNFCGLRPLLTSGTLGGYCSLYSNGFNPHANEIIAGNCSQ